ncbi:MAG: hypothetical protein A3A65_02850 [Candidatus Chisholmbacteria bacterium RIFCSPLOWO2_01_FULL_49_14]|uniref:dTDP-4-dehydrorhamnose 3,5-epimerase n=1 Tax=Candidatus Chisholmbacteria bacterium RIFCSPLOWO2_01_FULL_49_14 TaxID=1797593 RepID=A0A1G1W2Y4_9BACT|nr:MAG: hypothetical protein A3A65_02850 [Candidatus Chisholmbacteria bacterium RIFCSPLOWO2_01_FULL_49_14]
MQQNLPDGVKISDLIKHVDPRGYFIEVFKQKWIEELPLIQWNVVRSKKNALRGMRVHIKHYDYVIIFEGKAVYALRDLRQGSPTQGLVSMVHIEGKHPQSVIIPPGVAHGFYFFKPSFYVYGVTEYYDKEDELGFYFADPDAGIKWPTSDPIVTERDVNLPPLKSIMSQIPTWHASST